MTVLTVVQDVCAVIGVQIPSSLFANLPTDRTKQEMLALANEIAQRVAYNTRDWKLLVSTITYPGAATPVTEFDLPADFQRMLLTSNVWRSTNTTTPMRFIVDTDEWLNRRSRNISESFGEWTNYGGKLRVWPGLASTETITFPYMTKNCVSLNAGGVGTTFVNDADVFRLDERVLKWGMIVQWKAHKGSPYAEDMGTYGDALTYAMGHDQPAPIIIGRRPVSANAKVAYPWPAPT
jgi:hypothetical protein